MMESEEHGSKSEEESDERKEGVWAGGQERKEG